MNITDTMRRLLFEQTFGLSEADAAERATFLRRIGVPEEHIAGFCRPSLHAGTALGGSRPIDVQSVVEQVLGRQGAGSGDDTGHLRIEVIEVGPPAAPAEDRTRDQ